MEQPAPTKMEEDKDDDKIETEEEIKVKKVRRSVSFNLEATVHVIPLDEYLTKE